MKPVLPLQRLLSTCTAGKQAEAARLADQASARMCWSRQKLVTQPMLCQVTPTTSHGVRAMTRLSPAAENTNETAHCKGASDAGDRGFTCCRQLRPAHR